jgi:hypothetical protein
MVFERGLRPLSYITPPLQPAIIVASDMSLAGEGTGGEASNDHQV